MLEAALEVALAVLPEPADEEFEIADAAGGL